MKTDSNACPPSRIRSCRTPGFTLVEVLMAMGISSMFLFGFFQATILLQRMAHESQVRMEMSEGFRSFSQNLDRDVRSARQMLLYDSFPIEESDLETSERLGDGERGNLLILVYGHFEPSSASSGVQRFFLTRLKAYAHLPDSDHFGPILSYEKVFSTASSFIDLPDPDDSGFDPNDPAYTPIENQAELNEVIWEMLDDAAIDSELLLDKVTGKDGEGFFHSFRENAVVLNGLIFLGKNQDIIVPTLNYTIKRGG
ncbi:MAG: prepilin-type N-terminal cleavage/methylation domain-containing protein [Opitutales bacterium]|nr:prepilin-type N-terminal cleavage/methylation domain-containing protein [Opitutales bacterium]